MLYAGFSLERLEHTVHLKSKTFFALLEVREREIFAGFFACGNFHKEVQTCIRHDTSMGCSRRRGVGCKKKVRQDGARTHHPLISEETFEIFRQ